MAGAVVNLVRGDVSPTVSAQPSFRAIFRHVSLKDRALSSASQAGMINNLNDGEEHDRRRDVDPGCRHSAGHTGQWVRHLAAGDVTARLRYRTGLSDVARGEL